LVRRGEELARVRERLRDPDVSPGMTRELKRHVAFWRPKIAALEASS
jgi:hypothetical protein